MIPINLALQGGGSHGAFTWGVLDALLEDGGFEVRAITGASAGSMNAAVCAHGVRVGGRDGGREALERFWHGLAHARAPFAPISMNALRKALDPFGLTKAGAFQMFDMMTSVASPYQFNPWNLNPLRDLLKSVVDMDGLRAAAPFELFVAATNVQTGRSRVFASHEIGVEAVLASACLPHLFQSVMIDDAPYWDGGFVANPALYPLFRKDLPRDILLISINPAHRAGVPRSSAEIMDRMNEITFSSSLNAELRAIAFVQKLLDGDALRTDVRDNYRRVLMHAIRGDKALEKLGVESKYDTDWHFLTGLRDAGRAAFKAWAAENREAVGTRGTLDIRAEYLTD
jgi:NTE family protein